MILSYSNTSLNEEHSVFSKGHDERPGRGEDSFLVNTSLCGL